MSSVKGVGVMPLKILPKAAGVASVPPGATQGSGVQVLSPSGAIWWELRLGSG